MCVCFSARRESERSLLRPQVPIERTEHGSDEQERNEQKCRWPERAGEHFRVRGPFAQAGIAIRQIGVVAEHAESVNGAENQPSDQCVQQRIN